jgi:hypothetical protein
MSSAALDIPRAGAWVVKEHEAWPRSLDETITIRGVQGGAMASVLRSQMGSLPVIVDFDRRATGVRAADSR